MKKLFFLFAFFCLAFVSAQRPIITKWNANDGIIKLRIIGASSYTYQSTTDASITGSGTMASGLNTINLPAPGVYSLSITPLNSFRFVFFNSGLLYSDINKFIELSQWGDIKWNPDLSALFSGCNNLKITATDLPNFSQVTDMSSMFQSCSSITDIPNINQWNVSQVTSMANMFAGAYKFNSPIGDWDVSNVTNMSFMFYSTSKFNQDLDKWNVSRVTDMSHMFDPSAMDVTYGSDFNGNITTWNTKSVTLFIGMFQRATNFNQNLNNWDVSNAINMSYMFASTKNFNTPINNWDIKNVRSMTSMFEFSKSFNQPLGKWNVSKVWHMENMFNMAGAFNQNLGDWVLTQEAANFDKMFDNSVISCENYSKTLIGWASNPNTPTGRKIGVANMVYGPAAKPYRDALIAKGWSFVGDYFDPDCNDTLSTNETKTKNFLQIFPNPTADYFMLNAETADTLSLYDQSGKLVKTQKLTSGQNTVHIENLPVGNYVVKTSKGIAKIVKK